MSLVKKARLRRGLTLEQASKKLRISPGYLSQIENGQRQVGVERAKEIASIYGVRQEELFRATRFIRQLEEE
ncbi:helix-turn-helix domain-containing protein [Halalkalibacterium ligniniphilum]|uniref:helix-turn-helix domain-containing protein n=1 Tax=Halalkalibacterium ligniniphilum TaxID=1134413 RepID=UPI000348E41A|nr:helix-turn-helix transcriptional regulator [Halalkalibacterium ligniniphilum]